MGGRAALLSFYLPHTLILITHPSIGKAGVRSVHSIEEEKVYRADFHLMQVFGGRPVYDVVI